MSSSRTASRPLAAVVVVSTIVLLVAVSAWAVLPAGNQVRNAGAESGLPSEDGYLDVDIPKWRDDAQYTVVDYGESGFPTEAQAAEIGGGNQFFAGGFIADSSQPARSRASQRIALPADAVDDVDGGDVRGRLAGHLGGYANQDDNVVVRATFRDAAGDPLGSLEIGPVTQADRGGLTALLRVSDGGRVPVGTREIKIEQVATREDGAYNDGYSDNLSLRLSLP